jgi:hypothetical protein
MEGYTISELCQKLELNRKAVIMRLYRNGIEPLTREAIYPPDTLDRIKAVKRGRPAKQKPKS